MLLTHLRACSTAFERVFYPYISIIISLVSPWLRALKKERLTRSRYFSTGKMSLASTNRSTMLSFGAPKDYILGMKTTRRHDETVEAVK